MYAKEPNTAMVALVWAKKSAVEAIEQAGIGSRGSFPGPMFVAVFPAETNWGQRMAVYNSENGGESKG